MSNLLLAVFLTFTLHTSPPKFIPPTTNAIHCLAETIYHEARGEPEEGQRAVAHVVLNRVASDEFPDKVCAVVHQPKQFSWYGHVKNPRENNPIFVKAKILATTMILDYDMGLKDRTKRPYNATFFSREAPKLRHRPIFLGKIGHHKFFKAQDIK